MKKILKIMISTISLTSFMTYSAFGASGDVVFLGAEPSKPVIDSGLHEIAPDWQPLEQGNGYETNAGKTFFENTVKNGTLYWDFEDVSEAGAPGNVGIWAGGTANRNPEVISLEEVEYFNSVMAQTNPSSPSAEQDADVPGSVAKPSNSCMSITNETSNYLMHLTFRVKLSKNDIKVNQLYKLRFSAMGNSMQRGVWTDLRPYSDSETLLDSSPCPWTASRDLFDENANPLHTHDAQIKKHWEQFEVDITPREENFNSEGYTTLWFIVHNIKAYNSSFTYQYLYPNERIYLDNISLVPVSDEEVSEYRFNCEVEGAEGQNVVAEAVVDGGRKLFTVSGVCQNGNVVLTKDFSMNSDDEIITGVNRFTTSPQTDERIKLRVFSDTDDTLTIKNTSVNKKISSFDTRPLAVTYKIFSKNDEIIRVDDAKGMGSAFNINIASGIGKYTHYFATSDHNSTEFQLYDENDEIIGGRSFDLQKLFLNGTDLDYTSTELIKELGPGRYYMEFDVEQDVYGKTLLMNYCGAKSEVKIEGWATYGAEFDISEENISSMTDAVLTYSGADVTPLNITLKKTLDK